MTSVLDKLSRLRLVRLGLVFAVIGGIGLLTIPMLAHREAPPNGYSQRMCQALSSLVQGQRDVAAALAFVDSGAYQSVQRLVDQAHQQVSASGAALDRVEDWTPGKQTRSIGNAASMTLYTAVALFTGPLSGEESYTSEWRATIEGALGDARAANDGLARALTNLGVVCR